jgi:hypothetical protein
LHGAPKLGEFGDHVRWWWQRGRGLVSARTEDQNRTLGVNDGTPYDTPSQSSLAGAMPGIYT